MSQSLWVVGRVTIASTVAGTSVDQMRCRQEQRGRQRARNPARQRSSMLSALLHGPLRESGTLRARARRGKKSAWVARSVRSPQP
ncbi:hypothetical protein T484DRAFT_1936773 [Baffinella frigidus]|nr:hypothetical protein T484DRAFT_1936773 [Cryptophyta sp. CCMP2293]